MKKPLTVQEISDKIQYICYNFKEEKADIKIKKILEEYANQERASLILRTKKIELLEAYSLFLEKNGYMDIDWKTEPPFAIDEFLKTKNN